MWPEITTSMFSMLSRFSMFLYVFLCFSRIYRPLSRLPRTKMEGHR
jgi:hypothetical protein